MSIAPLLRPRIIEGRLSGCPRRVAAALVPLLPLLTLACAHQPRAAEPGEIPPREAREPLVIAHRGGALEAPENTLAAVRHARAVGADWCEVDVHLARDGVLVVMHDATLERTTDGAGRIVDLSAAEIRAAHAGRPAPAEPTRRALSELGVSAPDFGERFAEERVPTLAEVLAVEGVRVMIDVKGGAPAAAMAEAVVAEVRAAGAASRAMVASFDAALLAEVRARAPELGLISLVDDAAAIERHLALAPAVLAVQTGLAREALTRVPRGVALWAWVAYSPEHALALIELGVDGVITDAPGAVRELVQRRLRTSAGAPRATSGAM